MYSAIIVRNVIGTPAFLCASKFRANRQMKTSLLFYDLFRTGHDHFPVDENIHLSLLACGPSLRRQRRPSEFLNHFRFYGESDP